jgi:hypothetical protein
MKHITIPIIPLKNGKPDLDHGFAVECKNPSNDYPIAFEGRSIIFHGESFKIRGLGKRKLWREYFKVHRQRNENSMTLTLEARNCKPIFTPMSEEEFSKKLAIV